MDLVDLCSDRAKQDKMCGNSSYHAAGDRKGRAEDKRVTGRFLLGCPHLVLFSMATMPAAYGHERYGYAYLMMAGGFHGLKPVFYHHWARCQGFAQSPACNAHGLWCVACQS